MSRPFFIIAFSIAALSATALLAEEPPSADASANAETTASSDFETTSIRGSVTYWGETLERLHDIKLIPEADERLLVLETPDGEIYPLVEDLRGRSFRKDKRLREMDVELLIRRYEGSPLVQVIRIYEIQDDGKYIVDYWCDICAIVMFEKGPCDCCQDANVLRKRKVD